MYCKVLLWPLRRCFRRYHPLADNESPHHNGHENDYSDRVSPSPSFLELFLIYH
jgi:hypothetical protein